MAYTKTNWINNTTPVNATNMNKIETGIYNNDINKLDKTAVVNTTTAVLSGGQALNAVQNNPSIIGTLANKLEVLNVDRGYLTSKTLTSFNIMTNGKYGLKGQFSDSPLPSVTDGYWVLDVTTGADVAYTVQRATIIWSDLSGYGDRGKTFTRIYVDGAWGEWKQLATTTQVQAMLDALNA